MPDPIFGPPTIVTVTDPDGNASVASGQAKIVGGANALYDGSDKTYVSLYSQPVDYFATPRRTPVFDAVALPILTDLQYPVDMTIRFQLPDGYRPYDPAMGIYAQDSLVFFMGTEPDAELAEGSYSDMYLNQYVRTATFVIYSQFTAGSTLYLMPAAYRPSGSAVDSTGYAEDLYYLSETRIMQFGPVTAPASTNDPATLTMEPRFRPAR